MQLSIAQGEMSRLWFLRPEQFEGESAIDRVVCNHNGVYVKVAPMRALLAWTGTPSRQLGFFSGRSYALKMLNARKCANCANEHGLWTCKTCTLVRYCSIKCQMENRHIHKPLCEWAMDCFIGAINSLS